MTTRYKIYAAGIAAVLTAGLVFGQAVGGTGQTPRGQRAAKVMQFVANYLNLTDAQKAQAKTILQDTAPQVQPLVAQLKANGQALRDAAKTPIADADLQKLAAAQGQTIAQLIVIRTKAAQKLYGILTPDQQAKADQLHAMAKSLMQTRMHGSGF